MKFMKCEKCESKWESRIVVKNCPFCGNQLKLDSDIDKNDDLKTILKKIIIKYGYDILKDPKRVIALAKDYIPAEEKDIRLFKIACDINVLQSAYEVINDNSKEIIYRASCIKKMEEDYFIVPESAEYIVNLVFDAVTNKDTYFKNNDSNIVEKSDMPTGDSFRVNVENKSSDGLSDRDIINIIDNNTKVDSNTIKLIYKRGIELFKLYESTIKKLANIKGNKKDMNEKNRLVYYASIKFISYASRNGIAGASNMLGDIFFYGKGCERDSKAAEVYYLRAGRKNTMINNNISKTIYDHYIENIDGNLSGNIYGTMDGEIRGNYYGDICGVMNGNIRGDMHGNIQGELNGKILGKLYGNIEPKGVLNGDIMGGISGTIKGEKIGNIY